MISVFPNADTITVNKDNFSELAFSRVSLDTFPTGFSSVNAGSANEVNELEGASALALSTVAIAAVAATIF